MEDLLQTPTKTPQSKSNLYYHPSPSRPIYSDRFIPSRSSSNFTLFDTSPSSGQESFSAYNALLRTALGLGPPGVNRNIFRFKIESRQSFHSLFPFDDHSNPGCSPSPPVKPSRRSPYKVLDAPALQHDFVWDKSRMMIR